MAVTLQQLSQITGPVQRWILQFPHHGDPEIENSLSGFLFHLDFHEILAFPMSDLSLWAGRQRVRLHRFPSSLEIIYSDTTLQVALRHTQKKVLAPNQYWLLYTCCSLIKGYACTRTCMEWPNDEKKKSRFSLNITKTNMFSTTV